MQPLFAGHACDEDRELPAVSHCEQPALELGVGEDGGAEATQAVVGAGHEVNATVALVSPEGEPPLELERFEAAVGTPFTVQVDGGSSVVLTLAEVERLRAPAGWESFALLFDGQAPALPQWTYTVDHGTMGTFSLFVGPVAGGATGVRYEAVFNRPSPDGVAD